MCSVFGSLLFFMWLKKKKKKKEGKNHKCNAFSRSLRGSLVVSFIFLPFPLSREKKYFKESLES